MRVATIVEQLEAGDFETGMGMLSKLIGQASERERAFADLVDAIPRTSNDRIAAHLALGAGALVEQGAPAAALGRAVRDPLLRALAGGLRVVEATRQVAEDEDGEIVIAGRTFHPDTLRGIARNDRAAGLAWSSLELWYRPVVAAWTRAIPVLQEAQSDAALRRSIAALGGATQTSDWLGQLLATVFEARFLAVFPELRETWSFIADGVTDMGQLSALLSAELRDPLVRIASDPHVTPDVLEVMNGRGPQQGEGTLRCAFHCYPIEAVDPATGLPEDGRHEWRAPGGTGTHSLPADFLPGELSQRDGMRIVVIVGPHTPGQRFVRMIPAARTFDALRARVHSVRRVDATA